MKVSYKLLLPHLGAIFIFILLAIIYCLPTLQGKVIFQSDITNFLGVARETLDYRAKYHKEPLWTNSMFGGMPAYQVTSYYSANLVYYIAYFLGALLPVPANIVFLYCLGFYILLKVLDVNTLVAIIGSVAYAFSSFFFIILAIGHNSEAVAIAYMAPVFAGVILIFRGKWIAGTTLTALALSLELFADHPQITYYLFMMVLIYGVIQFIAAIRNKERIHSVPAFFKSSGMVIIAILISVGTDITNLWLTYDYSKYSTRGKGELTINQDTKSTGLPIDYATQWSYGVPETFTLLIPDFQGGESKYLGENPETLEGIDEQDKEQVGHFEQYWGDQPFTSGPVYAGAIICFFAILGLFIIKGPMKWFVLISTLLAIMLSWGKNFMSFTELFFYHFPGYNKFRSVSMILVIVEFCLPLMAAIVIDRIVKSKMFFEEKFSFRLFQPVKGMKLFLLAVIITGGFALVCYIMPGTISSFQKENEIGQTIAMVKRSNPKADPAQISGYVNNLMPYVIQARKKVFTADAGRTLIFIILSAAIVWVYVKKLININLFAGGLLFFVVMDMLNVDKRYLNSHNFVSKRAKEETFKPDAADEEILKDSTLDYRVYNTTVRPDQDGGTSYFHKSIGGYSGAKMKRYHELLDQIEEGNMAVLDMLNTKYFIREKKNGERGMMPNPGALGNAWFVNEYKIVPDADSEFIGLTRFDPAQTALADARFSEYLKGGHPVFDSAATIKLDSYQPNDLVYSSLSRTNEFCVFSEIYYKDGWDAFIDGKPSDYIRVDYVLRGMYIPAGNHTIEFKFEPSHYYTGEKISLASSILLFAGCILLLVMQFRKPGSALGS